MGVTPTTTTNYGIEAGAPSGDQSLTMNGFRVKESYAGPASWTTLDGKSPYYEREENVNTFPWTITAASGTAWPFSDVAIGADIPATGNVAGAGFSALRLAARTNTAVASDLSTGSATAIIRAESFCGVDQGATWGNTYLITDCDRNTKLAAAVSHSAYYLMNEFDMHVTNAGTGTGIGQTTNIISFISAVSRGAGTLAHFGAWRDITADYSNMFPGTTFAGPGLTPDYAFYSGARAATTALYAGPASTGNSQSSQIIELHATAGGGGDIRATQLINSSGVYAFGVPTGGSYVFQINSVTKLNLSATSVFGILGMTPQSAVTFATPTYALDATAGNYVSGTTAAGNVTINVATVLPAGTPLILSITSDAGGGRVITFGTNMRSTGTLTLTASKTCVATFWSDGTNYVEASRTTAIT